MAAEAPQATPQATLPPPSEATAPAAASAAAVAPLVPPTLTAAAICAKLSETKSALFDAEDQGAVQAFYNARECRPLWVDTRGPTRAAARAIAELGRAAEWGLDADDFKLVAARQPMTAGEWSDAQTADADLEITAAVLRYAHEAQGSRISEPDKLLSSYLDRKPALTGAADVLAEIAASSDPGAVLRTYQPAQDQFQKLKALLATLRGTPAPANVLTIARRGPTLQLGVRHPDVAVLKQRFAVASEAGKEQDFDQPLDAAIKKFQLSKSLGDDGIVGPATRAALSGEAPAKSSDKITAVLANMEEWRWMPRTLGATHVFVNVPSFSIVVTDKDKPVFEERVVVGTPRTQTPIFSKNMTTIVLRPPWMLPDSIKLTALLSGRSIERQGYIVMRNGHTVDSARVNWGKANLSEYTIYQPSGDDNALGLVKLLFPNKHSVYLHDTPSKGLFNEPVRLFSHGCMRVRNPQQLAQKIFDIDQGDAAPDVKRLVRKGPLNNVFTLATPIPVHVGYFTVWVDDAGEAKFYPDYYGHQKRITLALAGKWNQIDVGEDHLAAVDTSALKSVRIGGGDSKSKKSDGDGFDSPMGLTSVGTGTYQRYGDNVGDIIRRTLGF
jgi:murein L,D-transpeptidase YcbB/YkuD